MNLSPREKQVLALLSTNKKYQEIADYLGISRDTVRTHIKRLYLKLDAHSGPEAVANYELIRNGRLPVRQYRRPQGWKPNVGIPDYNHSGKIRK